MQIVSCEDQEANFIADANRRLRSKVVLTLKIIKTNIEDLSIHIAQQKGQFGYGYQYDIVLKHGKRTAAVIMLNSCNDLNMVSGRYHNRVFQVFEPHCYTSRAYRGRGYVESIYRWLLDSGLVFISCGKQTACSFGLWQKLGHSYGIRLMDTRYMRYVNEADSPNNSKNISVYNTWVVTVLNDQMRKETEKEKEIKLVCSDVIVINEPVFA
jgi:hypothetical protein